MSAFFQPSLKALRSFEAAARLQSLTLAAQELNVSVSAIAFQVRQVEAGLGQKLLARSGRALAVTESGRSLARELGAAFALIDASVARSRPTGEVRRDRQHAAELRRFVAPAPARGLQARPPRI